jgi:hypothetical protein
VLADRTITEAPLDACESVGDFRSVRAQARRAFERGPRGREILASSPCEIAAAKAACAA